MHTAAESQYHVLPQYDDNTSAMLATYDKPQHISTSTLLEDDMPYIEYSMVSEPESLVVFEEKEYQQVQAVCSDFSEDMEKNNICDCALKARRLRGRRMRSPSLSKNKTLNYQCKAGLQTSNKFVQGCKAHVVRKQRFRPPSASICKFYEKKKLKRMNWQNVSYNFS